MPPTPIPRRAFLKAAAALPLAGLVGCPPSPALADDGPERVYREWIFTGGVPRRVQAGRVVLFHRCRFARCGTIVVPPGSDWSFVGCSFDRASWPERADGSGAVLMSRCYRCGPGETPERLPLILRGA